MKPEIKCRLFHKFGERWVKEYENEPVKGVASVFSWVYQASEDLNYPPLPALMGSLVNGGSFAGSKLELYASNEPDKILESVTVDSETIQHYIDRIEDEPVSPGLQALGLRLAKLGLPNGYVELCEVNIGGCEKHFLIKAQSQPFGMLEHSQAWAYAAVHDRNANEKTSCFLAVYEPNGEILFSVTLNDKKHWLNWANQNVKGVSLDMAREVMRKVTRIEEETSYIR